MTPEEVVIRLGLDKSRLSQGMAALGPQMQSAGKQVGAEFHKGARQFGDRIFQAFGLVQVFSYIGNLSRKFKELEGDAEALEKAFGNLTESQRQALENVSYAQEKTKGWLQNAALFVTGSIADFGALLGKMSTGLNPMAAMREIMAEEMDAMSARAKAIEAKAISERTAKEKKALDEFYAYRDKLMYERMTIEEKIRFQEKTHAIFIAEFWRSSGEQRWKLAQAILEIEQRIAALKSKQSSAPMSFAPSGVPGVGPSGPSGGPMPDLSGSNSPLSDTQLSNPGFMDYWNRVQGARENYLDSLRPQNNQPSEPSQTIDLTVSEILGRIEERGIKIQPVP